MAPIKQVAAANSALYDKTMNSSGLSPSRAGSSPSFIANIKELMTALKGATPDRRGRRQVYSTRQAAKVARTGGK